MKSLLHAIVFIALATTGGSSSAQPITNFTYQGSLSEGGTPATGAYYMEFSLYDAEVGGTLIGGPWGIEGVNVSDGRFTVELNFGAAMFDSGNPWLDISVEAQVLTPRQRLTSAPFAIQTRGISVDNSNNVGIGSNAPESNLHIKQETLTSGDPLRMLVLDSHDDLNNFDLTLGSGPGILFKVPYQHDSHVGAAIDAVRTTNVETDSSTALAFSTTPNNETLSEAMRIGPNGNVGIGTTSPTAKLHVEGSSNFSGSMIVTTDSPSTATAIHGQSNDGTQFETSVGVLGESNEPDNVGVGVYGIANGPGGRGVVGTANSLTGGTMGLRGISRSTPGVGVNGLCSEATGYDSYAGGAGINYGSPSSIRWKNNIRNIENPLDKIAQLRGVYYDRDEAHGGGHDLGMIAEELGKVLPEIVQYEENGIDAIGMDYSRMTPLLVEAVNAMQAERIAERAEKDAQLAERDEQIEQLNQRITRLEQMILQISTEPNGESK